MHQVAFIAGDSAFFDLSNLDGEEYGTFMCLPARSTIALITRADDFGSSPGANAAILDAVDGGLVRNVGVMAPAPHLTHRIHELRERQQQICLGLHATLTSEWPEVPWGPLLPPDQVPGLTLPDGRFPPDSPSLGERATVAEMMAEIAEQLERVRREGLFPKYLDCHMVFSWLPGVADALQAFCEREQLVYANHARYLGLPIALSEEQAPTKEDLAAALETLQGLAAGRRLYSVFHPAYEEGVSRRFADGVAAERHREALRLAEPGRLLDLLRGLNLAPAMYAGEDPIPSA